MTDFMDERFYRPIYHVPQQSVWLYVDGTFNHLSTATNLQDVYETRIDANAQYEIRAGASGVCDSNGWRADGGRWEFDSFSTEVLDFLEAEIST